MILTETASEVVPMSDENELKERLKETILRDFGNVYRWLDRHAEFIEKVDAVDELDEGS